MPCVASAGSEHSFAYFPKEIIPRQCHTGVSQKLLFFFGVLLLYVQMFSTRGIHFSV